MCVWDDYKAVLGLENGEVLTIIIIMMRRSSCHQKSSIPFSSKRRSHSNYRRQP